MGQRIDIAFPIDIKIMMRVDGRLPDQIGIGINPDNAATVWRKGALIYGQYVTVGEKPGISPEDHLVLANGQIGLDMRRMGPDIIKRFVPLVQDVALHVDQIGRRSAIREKGEARPGFIRLIDYYPRCGFPGRKPDEGEPVTFSEKYPLCQRKPVFFDRRSGSGGNLVIREKVMLGRQKTITVRQDEHDQKKTDQEKNAVPPFSQPFEERHSAMPQSY